MTHRILLFGMLATTVAVAEDNQQSTTSPGDKAQGVSNPKELTEPVRLVAADIIMNGSESVCGKLRGANGKEFWFYLERGPWAFEPHREEGLYVGHTSGDIPETARARFQGWTQADFCLLLERA